MEPNFGVIDGVLSGLLFNATTGREHDFMFGTGNPGSGLFGVGEALYNRAAARQIDIAAETVWAPTARAFPFLWLVPGDRFSTFRPAVLSFPTGFKGPADVQGRYNALRTWLDRALVHVVVEMKK
jgi:hypothetical protein